MTKQTRQASGVVGGTLDVSRRTAVRPTADDAAGQALERRKTAARRARKVKSRSQRPTKVASPRGKQVASGRTRH